MTDNLFDAMKAYVSFGQNDSRALASLSVAAAPHLDEIVREFYGRIEADPGARAVVDAHSTRDRLADMLRTWLEQFLSGPHDDAYYQRRRRIGEVHVRIGLEPHYVFTAMNVLREGVAPLADDAQRSAVHKLMDLELAIINNVYWEHVTAGLQRKERLATIGELAGSFAHEIRNPLAAMQNAAWLLRERAVAAEDDRAQRALQIMNDKVVECARLVESLLEFARVRPLETARFSILPLIRVAVSEATPDVPITIEAPNALDGLTVNADGAQLKAVLRNLIRNAAQAVQQAVHESGAAGAAGAVTVHVAAEEQMVRIQVADDGPGIDEAQQHNIFQPLVTSKTYGLGLGLPYSRRVAKAHGGTLTVESRPGNGATFTLELPR